MRQGQVTYKRAQRVAESFRHLYAWHAGKLSPLYCFASTGVMLEGLLDEIRRCEQAGKTWASFTQRTWADLDALKRYVIANKGKGDNG